MQHHATIESALLLPESREDGEACIGPAGALKRTGGRQSLKRHDARAADRRDRMGGTESLQTARAKIQDETGRFL